MRPFLPSPLCGGCVDLVCGEAHGWKGCFCPVLIRLSSCVTEGDSVDMHAWDSDPSPPLVCVGLSCVPWLVNPGFAHPVPAPALGAHLTLVCR